MTETLPASNAPELDAWSRDLKEDLRDEAHERWAFIDRLTEGKGKFDASAFWGVVADLGLSKGTINNRLSIGAKFPPSRRREIMLPAIHDEFRKLDDGLTAHALKNAEEGHWTREQCRMRMKAFKGGDVQALELEWRPAPVRSKAMPAETEGEGEGEESTTAVFDATGAGQAMDAEERREKLAAYADQKFASGNDFFEQIAATIEKKGDPRRFIRECDVKRLNPQRARALAAFFMGIAEEIERGKGGMLLNNQGLKGSDADASVAHRNPLPAVRSDSRSGPEGGSVNTRECPMGEPPQRGAGPHPGSVGMTGGESAATHFNPDLYANAVRLVVANQNASVSHLQRRWALGYNAAAGLIEDMQKAGIISEPDFVGRRVVLVPAASEPDPALPPATAEEAAADDAGAPADASASDFSTAPLEEHPGDRERLGHARPSEDEAPAGGAWPDGPQDITGQFSRLADNLTQTGTPPGAADSGARSGDDDPDIPTFLRRGHPDCVANADPAGEGADA